MGVGCELLCGGAAIRHVSMHPEHASMCSSIILGRVCCVTWRVSMSGTGGDRTGVSIVFPVSKEDVLAKVQTGMLPALEMFHAIVVHTLSGLDTGRGGGALLQ